MGIVYVVNRSSDKTKMMNKDSTTEQNTVVSDEQSTTMDKSPETVMENKKISDSRYIKFNKDDFDSNTQERRVLFFYASWCPTCQPADANFSENQNNLPEDVLLIRVNYDDSDTEQAEKDLATKYGITYQHTFVQIDSSGKEVAKWNGGQFDKLISNLK